MAKPSISSGKWRNVNGANVLVGSNGKVYAGRKAIEQYAATEKESPPAPITARPSTATHAAKIKFAADTEAELEANGAIETTSAVSMLGCSTYGYYPTEPATIAGAKRMQQSLKDKGFEILNDAEVTEKLNSGELPQNATKSFSFKMTGNIQVNVGYRKPKA